MAMMTRRDLFKTLFAGAATALVAQPAPILEYATNLGVTTVAAPKVTGAMVAAAWEDYVKTDPTDQIFPRYWLLENLKSDEASIGLR